MNESPVHEALRDRSTHLAACRRVLPFLDDADASIRAEAAAGLGQVIEDHPGGGDLLSAVTASAPSLLLRLDDAVDGVCGAAHRALVTLARATWRHGDYADAAPLLDALIERDVRGSDPASSFVLWLWRWECRLALQRDAEAEADLTAFRHATSELDERAMATLLTPPHHEPPELDAWRAAALDRVAAIDGSPTRARHLLEESRALTQRRVDTELVSIAAGEPPPRHRYLPAETYALLARLAEREGDVDSALALVTVAQTLSPTGGLPPHLHPETYGAWAQRLKREHEDRLGAPADYDRAWFADPCRTPSELEAAWAVWSKVDWRLLPSNADEALATPLLALLMTDLQKLGPVRAAYAASARPEDASLHARHLALFEAHLGHRLHTWQSALVPSGGALTVVFDPMSRRPGNPDAKARGFMTWLSATRTATTARAILEALPPDAWENLAVPLALRGHFLDRDRYLAEIVVAATGNVAVAAHLVRLYGTLHREKGVVPKRVWEDDAGSLDLPRTRPLALALFSFAAEAARRLWIAEHTPEPELLDVKLLWPLAFVWHEALEEKLAAFLDGALDGRKKASPSMRAKREKTIAWISARGGR